MYVTSTNIAKPQTIIFRGKKVTTGIYKTPTIQPIYLGKSDVKDDEVTDRRYHGGEFKACYLFSENHYDYWKNLYPHLDWNWGMFGENLTINGLDETKLHIGDIYKIGKALVQITQPREPCYKLGVKFSSQKVVKQFLNHGFPGTYVRVLEEGFVKSGDAMSLIESAQNSLTIHQFYNLLFSKDKNQEHLALAVINEALPLRKREKLQAFII
ncbi:MOSC domain-containing protein [Confluentibacter sediminis]|uniref:MOSC domain-containing protein n=1 Tax=Confluentibacter sediminis TaxID=2219045 RepID=UPI000DAF1FBF|nr:MOSC domain-containing protein [Confluentibacter sediminis]